MHLEAIQNELCSLWFKVAASIEIATALPALFMVKISRCTLNSLTGVLGKTGVTCDKYSLDNRELGIAVMWLSYFCILLSLLLIYFWIPPSLYTCPKSVKAVIVT